MVKIIAGIFFILHGLVHLLYFGQSARWFELQPGMLWPDGSWAFSKLLGASLPRTLAAGLCILAAAAFLIGSLGLFSGQSWWRAVIVGASVISGILYLLFWNGQPQQLDSQGGIGLLIDGVILVAILGFQWP